MAVVSNPKRTRLRVPKILKAANGAPCMMDSPVCNHDLETTVFCHLNFEWAGKGMGQKADDTAGFFGCSECHRWFDETSKYRPRVSYQELDDEDVLKFIAFRACVRTWRYLVETGVLS